MGVILTIPIGLPLCENPHDRFMLAAKESSCRKRSAEQIGKQLRKALVGQQLKVEQVDTQGFETRPILNALCDLRGKVGKRFVTAVGTDFFLHPMLSCQKREWW